MKKPNGFTLIELLIVVAIVAILAAIALPSYSEHVRKTRRAQAKTDMIQIVQNMEREFTLKRSYAGFPVASYAHSPLTGRPYYDVSFENLTATTYTIVLDPVAPQDKDTKCGKLTLNQLGVKTASGTLGTAGCW